GPYDDQENPERIGYLGYVHQESLKWFHAKAPSTPRSPNIMKCLQHLEKFLLFYLSALGALA
ncbi:MAG: hypothetical protein ACRER2_08400, partial [Methylococcales bacterium]